MTLIYTTLSVLLSYFYSWKLYFHQFWSDATKFIESFFIKKPLMLTVFVAEKTGAEVGLNDPEPAANAEDGRVIWI